MTKRLADCIGIPALLEQTAEEATELAFACLKAARHARNENPVELGDMNDLIWSMAEEAADVQICLEELMLSGTLPKGDLDYWWKVKYSRLEERMARMEERDDQR